MKRFMKKEGGFTLIELLVVILIIGILIAVAAPSFLGQTAKAQISAQKQDLSVAYRAVKAGSITEAQQGNFSGMVVADALTDSEGAGFLAKFTDEGTVANVGESVTLTHTAAGDVQCNATFSSTGGVSYANAAGHTSDTDC